MENLSSGIFLKVVCSFSREATNVMWLFMLQGLMIGYGKYRYKSGDWCKIGLASQKNYISVYICAVENGKYIAETYKDALPKANIGKMSSRTLSPK